MFDTQKNKNILKLATFDSSFQTYGMTKRYINTKKLSDSSSILGVSNPAELRKLWIKQLKNLEEVTKTISKIVSVANNKPGFDEAFPQTNRKVSDKAKLGLEAYRMEHNKTKPGFLKTLLENNLDVSLRSPIIDAMRKRNAEAALKTKQQKIESLKRLHVELLNVDPIVSENLAAVCKILHNVQQLLDQAILSDPKGLHSKGFLVFNQDAASKQVRLNFLKFFDVNRATGVVTNRYPHPAGSKVMSNMHDYIGYLLLGFKKPKVESNLLRLNAGNLNLASVSEEPDQPDDANSVAIGENVNQEDDNVKS